MSSKPKKSKTIRRVPLTRAQLLPIAPAAAHVFSLKNHLALVAMRNGRGNADLASELLKTLYLTYFAFEKHRLEPSIETYLEAEAVLKLCIYESVTDDAWQIADEQCGAIEAVLRVYDTQLASTPLHLVEMAKGRLDRILREGCFPDLEAIHGTRC